MKEMLFFSIVIPAWNEEKYIRNTLLNLALQTYSFFEIIVVNNNSTDNTKSIAEECATTNAKIIVVDCPEPGVLHARDRGFRAAYGDIIVQLDADCLPSPDWLQNAARYFEDKRVVALAGKYRLDGPLWIRFLLNGFGGLMQYLVLEHGNRYVQKKKYGGFMIGGNAFIRTSVLKKMDGYEVRRQFMNDDLATARVVCTYGILKFGPDITVNSSSRRYRDCNGEYTLQNLIKVTNAYNKGTMAIFRGKEIPIQETLCHPR